MNRYYSERRGTTVYVFFTVCAIANKLITRSDIVWWVAIAKDVGALAICALWLGATKHAGRWRKIIERPGHLVVSIKEPVDEAFAQRLRDAFRRADLGKS